MTDMPEWRAWADRAARDIDRPLRRPRRKNPLFRCKCCTHKTTRNQARKNGGVCGRCRTPLPAFR